MDSDNLSLNSRELAVARIISGKIALNIGSVRFYLFPLNRSERYQAQLLYLETFEEARIEGLFEEPEDLEGFLITRDLWSKAEAKKLTNVPKDIEKFKEALYESRTQSNKAASLRKLLAIARQDFEKLYAKRHGYDHLCCDGQATLTKGRYIVGKGLRTASGKRVFRHDSFWRDQSSLLDDATGAYARTRLNDQTIRELARTDPWRSYWASRNSEAGLFGVPSVDLTDEQSSIIGWSSLYENVRGHSDTPNDDVINDDDMLDGWLSIQRKKTQGEANKVGDLVKNEKIKNADHVFIPADTTEDAALINSFNDERTKQVKASRTKTIAEKGTVSEWNMPDTKKDMIMKMNQMGFKNVK